MLSDTTFPPRQICYLAQQAAEKALKAALIHSQIAFPYVHDLDELRDLLPPDWRVRAAAPDLEQLTQWVRDARYPDGHRATELDARGAVATARSVVEAVVADLAARGLPGDPAR